MTRNGKVGVQFMPTMKSRKSLTQKLKGIFRRFQPQPISRIIGIINPILRGWVNYFRVGMSSRCFGVPGRGSVNPSPLGDGSSG
ncbi:group II intron maturase-specific domain-containing protein [Granulosicoccus antarcticus]|uniref:group II intron maturase-specific domain-containing protein n=1 Tax=Granulosicoccus antarcticus TaxID=437505 RepID=UPI000B5AA72B